MVDIQSVATEIRRGKKDRKKNKDRNNFLWPTCVADADIIFLPCGFFYLSIFLFSSRNLSNRRVDVYTSTHGVALVRI